MSSICALHADKMSCDAMSSLSKAALIADFKHQSYLTNDPSCFRYQALADRGDEHLLQKSLGISRNVCFEKTPEFQQGEWQTTFPPMGVHLPTFYEQWTRAKNNTAKCMNHERPECFKTFSPEPYTGPCGFSLRR
jgi:hypothetical protein